VDYINKFGMDDEMGLFSTEVLGDNHDARLVEQCRIMLNTLYAKTLEQLRKNLPLLEAIAKELLEQETLNAADLDRICG
jgi:cell division protease FtsH